MQTVLSQSNGVSVKYNSNHHRNNSLLWRHYFNYAKSPAEENWSLVKNSNLVRHEARIQIQDCLATKYKLSTEKMLSKYTVIKYIWSERCSSA